MQVKYNMVVDFARPNKSNTILVAEDDANSRKTTFTLLADKAPFDMTGVTTATILGITSTGARIYADATIEQDEEGNNINVVSWVIPPALTDTAGNITLTVTLADNVGARITSFEFYVKVRNALYNEDDFIDEDDMQGFRDLLARTRAALERMEQMVQQDALPNPYPIRIRLDNVTYEYNGESLVEILKGEVAYLGDVTGTVDVTADDSSAAQAAASAAAAAQSAEDAAGAYTDTRLLIDNFQSQIPTATVTKNVATHQSIIVITDKNGTTSATVEDGVVGSSWYAGTDIAGTVTSITGYAGNEGDYYLNTANGNVYRCVATGDISTALWDYVLTMGANNFGTIKINTGSAVTPIVAVGPDAFEMVAGTNITLVPDNTNKKVTIHSTGGGGGTSSGDMLKSIYDQNNDGIVDAAETLDDGTDTLTASIAELNYVDGVTSAIQTQLNGKASTGHTHLSADITDLSIPDDLADLNDDSTHRLVTDTEKAGWDAKQDALTAGTGISIDSTTNTISATAPSIDGYKTVKVGSTLVSAGSAEDTIEFVASTGMTITPDATNKRITFVSSGGGGTSTGDMLKMVYDQNNNGIVDAAETLYDGTDTLSASIAELNYVDGVTSAIQTQIDGKAASSHTHTKTDITDFPTIPTALTQLDTTGSATCRVVTDTQIAAWNNKQNALSIGAGIDITNNTISVDCDSTPTSGSPKPVTSGGVYTAINNLTPAALDDLTDVTITGTPSQGQILMHDGTSWVNGSGGGHTMLPNPAGTGADAPTEAKCVQAINTAITQGPTNDKVASEYTVGIWSNTVTQTFTVSGIAGSSTPISQTGIGTWPADVDNPTTAEKNTWIKIPELYGIGSMANVDIHLSFDPTKSQAIALGGYVIDDAESMSDGQGGSINCGKMCIKFANEITEAETHTAIIGIELTIKRAVATEVGGN